MKLQLLIGLLLFGQSVFAGFKLHYNNRDEICFQNKDANYSSIRELVVDRENANNFNIIVQHHNGERMEALWVTAERVQAYLNTHPEIPNEIRSAILNHVGL